MPAPLSKKEVNLAVDTVAGLNGGKRLTKHMQSCLEALLDDCYDTNSILAWFKRKPGVYPSHRTTVADQVRKLREHGYISFPSRKDGKRGFAVWPRIIFFPNTHLAVTRRPDAPATYPDGHRGHPEYSSFIHTLTPLQPPFDVEEEAPKSDVATGPLPDWHADAVREGREQAQQSEEPEVKEALVSHDPAVHDAIPATPATREVTVQPIDYGLPVAFRKAPKPFLLQVGNPAELPPPPPQINFWLEVYSDGTVAVHAKHEGDTSPQILAEIAWNSANQRLELATRDIHAKHLVQALDIEAGQGITTLFKNAHVPFSKPNQHMQKDSTDA